MQRGQRNLKQTHFPEKGAVKTYLDKRASPNAAWSRRAGTDARLPTQRGQDGLRQTRFPHKAHFKAPAKGAVAQHYLTNSPGECSSPRELSFWAKAGHCRLTPQSPAATAPLSGEPIRRALASPERGGAREASGGVSITQTSGTSIYGSRSRCQNRRRQVEPDTARRPL